jgi:GGDEF domain-containing protein
MNIPVAVISFSIKNYKRYFDRFGKIEMLKMFDAVSEIIKGRLAPGDFSARVGRNKYIIVLPGKDRKYCASFTAILKNETANRFNTPEFRLLISFISSIFPDDGEDIFSLLEIMINKVLMLDFSDFIYIDSVKSRIGINEKETADIISRLLLVK